MPPVTGPTSSGIDPDLKNRINTQEAQEVIRRGNIDDILKVTGISKKDWEDYLKSQSVSLNRDIVQDHQLYSVFNSVPAPYFSDSFSPELGVGKVTPQDHATFMESIGRITGKASVAGGKASTYGKSQEVPADLAAYTEGIVQDNVNVIQGITDNIVNINLDMQLAKGSLETKKAREKFLQILATTSNPEVLFLAFLNYKQREAGEGLVRAGVDMTRKQQESKRNTAAISGLDASKSENYAKIQQANQKSSSLGMDMSQLGNFIQSNVQNVESILNVGKSVIGDIAKTRDAMIRNQAR